MKRMNLRDPYQAFRHALNAAIMFFGVAYLLTPLQAANLVTNGDFEQLLVPGVSSEFGDRLPSQQVTGWTTNGYNFVFTPGTADTSGAAGEFGNLALWGPN